MADNRKIVYEDSDVNSPPKAVGGTQMGPTSVLAQHKPMVAKGLRGKRITQAKAVEKKG